MQINISIVSSKTGGTPGEVDAYDRETTIDRIQQAIEAIVSEHVPYGQISTVKTRVKKPSGAIRRMVRGMSGIQTITIELRITIGSFSDMDRVHVIRTCRETIPALVTANVPAHHLCSLVIGLKNGSTAA